MKSSIDSRNFSIDTEKCVEAAGGRYTLVVLASQRLRELKRQHRESGRYMTPIDALLDVQEGRIDPVAYLKKIK